MKMKLKYNKRFLTISTMTGDGCEGLMTYVFEAPYDVPEVMKQITNLAYRFKMTDKARVRMQEFLKDYCR